MFSLRTMLAAVTLLLLASCKKTPLPGLPPVQDHQMDITPLNNQEVRQKGPIAILDLNKDGRKDLIFGTMLVGDPLYMQDKMKLMVTSDIDTNLPVNELEQSPVMTKGNQVPLNNFNGYHWYNASGVMLAQKITGLTGPPFWEGNWKAVTSGYLPVQVLKNGQRFNGWVQLSVDMANEKVVLHEAAISKVAEKAIVIP